MGSQLEGTYHDLGTFLERVSKFPRIINVGNIHIRAQDVQSGAIDGHGRLHGDHVRADRRATGSSDCAGGRSGDGVMPVTRAFAFTSLTVLLTTGVGFAQAPHAGAPAPAAPVAAPATPAAAPGAPAAAPAAQATAEKKPDAVEPQGFTYNPEGRRDPFVSLLRRGVDSAQTESRRPASPGSALRK